MPRRPHQQRATTRQQRSATTRSGRVERKSVAPHATRRTRKPNRHHRLARLFPAAGLRAQVRAGIALARATPGLSVYLGGGVAIWLLSRALVGHGLASSPLGALAVGSLHLLSLAVVAVLYFRRCGHLRQAKVDLIQLSHLLAERRHCQAEAASGRHLIRLLRWSLRIHE